MNRFFSRISLGPALAVPLVVVFCLGSLLVAYVSISAGRSTARDIAAKLSGSAAEESVEKLGVLMRYPVLLNEANANALASGALRMSDAAVRDRFFSGQMKAFPQVSYSFYGREDASFYGARRNEADQIEAIHNDAGTRGSSLYYSIDAAGNPVDLKAEIKNFDCRTRPWYAAGIAAGKPVYSEIYRHFVYRDLAVTAAHPVRSQSGGWDGVFGVDFRLDRINAFLEEMSAIPGSAIVVAERRSGLLIGNSLKVPNYEDKGDSLVRLSAKNPPPPFPSIADFAAIGSGVSLDTDSGRIRVETRPFRYLNLDWIVLVVMPYAAFTGTIDATIRLEFFLCAAVMALSVLIGLLWFRRLTLPIRKVVDAADRLARGEWNYTAPEGTYRELSQLAHSFNAMAAQLRASISGLEEAVAERTKELAEANRALSENNAAKDRFFAILAHDLRNPVGALSESLRLISDGSLSLDDEERPRILNEMASVSQNVSQVLENLLDWAASQRGDMAFSPEEHDLDELIAESILLVRQHADNKRIRVEYEARPARAYCDANMVRVLIRNLLSNAVKFTAPGGRVAVSAEYAGERVVVSVSDSGIGIPEEKLKTLLTPGSSGRSLGTAGERGTGLGLLLCREFAERHGGALEVSSMPGKGSVFRFTLPRGPARRQS